uniref:Uncharacterized protein n=1 Tax=Arundo donax TaxID=35708 RepID=A0A0A9C5T1_ARUDO
MVRLSSEFFEEIAHPFCSISEAPNFTSLAKHFSSLSALILLTSASGDSSPCSFSDGGCFRTLSPFVHMFVHLH